MINEPKEIMKRVLLILALSIGTLSVSAQNFSSEFIYQKYKGSEGVISIWLPGIAMKLAASIADLDGPEKDLLRCVKSMKVLTIEDSDLYPDVNFANEIKIRENRGAYELLLEVHDGEDDVIICGKMKDDKLKDLLIVVGGSDNVLVHIKGRMRTDMIQSLAEVAGVDNLNIDYLSQL